MSIDIGEIKPGSLTIKVLTSNTTSMTLVTEEKFEGKVIQPMVNANRAIAEHGLALSIKILEDGLSRHILMDAGGPMQTIIENSKQFKVNLNDVEKVILSHGHFDHFGGLTKLIPNLKEGCDLYINPVCFEQNQIVLTKTGEEIPAEELGDSLRTLEKEGKLAINKKMPLLNKKVITNLAEQNNVKIIEASKPEKLYNGVITSGKIELFDTNEISKGIYLAISRKEFKKHTFRDETSIYLNVAGKGLVVISGCAHAGIINNVKHAQKLTGIEKMYAIIGGFHKEYETMQNIEETVKFFENLNPEVTCGMHCTGFNFNRMMARHPSHTLGVVGTEFHL